MSKNKPRMTIAKVQPGMLVRANKEWVRVNSVTFHGEHTILSLENGVKFKAKHEFKLGYRAGVKVAPAVVYSSGRCSQDTCDTLVHGDTMRHK